MEHIGRLWGKKLCNIMVKAKMMQMIGEKSSNLI